MSQENVEMFHKAVDAYSRGDLDPYLESAHPDVEWYPFTGQAEGGGAYRGHDGVRQWWSNLETNLDAFEASVDECRDLGDTVIAFGQLRIRFKSGVSLEPEIAWVAHRTRAEALEAAGLRE